MDLPVVEFLNLFLQLPIVCFHVFCLVLRLLWLLLLLFVASLDVGMVVLYCCIWLLVGLVVRMCVLLFCVCVCVCLCFISICV